MEKEKDGQIAFMDIKITRTDNGSIETDVYRKRTHTDQILNYNSNHPTQHKVSCLKTLLNRIDTHCSTTESKKKELDYLYDTFRKNNYPKHFIDSDYKRRQQNRTQDTSTEENNERPIRRITLPYINKISETTARILDKHNLKVAHKPTNKHKFKIQDSRTLFNHGKNSSGYILQTIAQTKLQIQKKIYIYMLHWKTCFP